MYSDADRGRLHTQAADEAYRIGPGPADESYLLADVIVETALRAGAEAVHPGYGFLAENAAFARKVEEAGLTWIGPPPAAIELMGSKTEARTAMKAAGVPIIPGATDPVRTVEGVIEIGEEIGYPLIIKAAAGGGGKGMELVSEASGAAAAFEAAQRQGLKFFADDAVYVERYLEGPRHVEAQILADAHGNVLFLGERDCTIQRRHQKLIEETPSPAVDEALRERIGEIAVDAARAAGYRSAGTIEGLLTADGRVLLHGDEHPDPGRAHGDRARHRPRSRAGADPDRAGRADLGAAGGRQPARARDRVPHQRRGRRQGIPARARA